MPTQGGAEAGAHDRRPMRFDRAPDAPDLAIQGADQPHTGRAQPPEMLSGVRQVPERVTDGLHFFQTAESSTQHLPLGRVS